MGAWLRRSGVEDPGEDPPAATAPDPGWDIEPLPLDWVGEVMEADRDDGKRKQAEWRWLESIAPRNGRG